MCALLLLATADTYGCHLAATKFNRKYEQLEDNDTTMFLEIMLIIKH